MEKTLLRVLMCSCFVFLGCSSDKDSGATITSISPDVASSGDAATIFGKGFGNNSETVQVYFGDNPAVINSLSDTRVQVTVPDKESGSGNRVDVYVRTGGKKSNGVKFEYSDHVPALKSLGYSKGLYGETVDITGSRFNTSAGGMKVYFNDTEAEVISVTETTITVEVPYLYENLVSVSAVNTQYPDSPSNKLTYRYDLIACDSIAIVGADWTVDNSIREDIVLRHGNMVAFDSKQQISYIEIPLGDDIELGMEYQSPSGLTKTTTMSNRVGAFAGINASYFSTWGAHDYFRVDGVERTPPSGWRSSPGYVNGCVVLNGTRDLSFVKVPNGSPGGSSVPGENVMMVGPMLRYNSVTQSITSVAHNTDRHPRSGIGVTKDDKVIFIVVDGRASGLAEGVTNAQFALIMRFLGATDALNLDGGGSSTLFVKDYGSNGIVNRPSDGSERNVANIIYARFK